MFSEWLSKLRKAKGLTQKQLAKKAGISRSYVGHLENDREHTVTNSKPKPDKEIVIALATALEGDIDTALSLAGYANSAIPKEIIEEGFEGLAGEDIKEIVLFIKFRKAQK